MLRRGPYDFFFCGTDSFAAVSLEALIQHIEVCRSLHVLTPADTKQGWGAGRMRVAPVKQLALRHNLPHHHVPEAGMSGYKPPHTFPIGPSSILLTCSFGHLIPSSLLGLFPDPLRRLNLHPSLLPKLRGAAPIQWSIARRLTQGGVTVQSLEEGKFDAGRIVGQEGLTLPTNATYETLEHLLAKRGSELLIEVLRNLPEHEATSYTQDESHVTYACKVKRSHVEIRWTQWTSLDIEARSRAFGYLYPLSTTLVPAASSGFPSLRVLLDDCHLVKASLSPGQATYSEQHGCIVIGTREDCIGVRSLKAQGKKSKPAQEWWRGFKDRADKGGYISFVHV